MMATKTDGLFLAAILVLSASGLSESGQQTVSESGKYIQFINPTQKEWDEIKDPTSVQVLVVIRILLPNDSQDVTPENLSRFSNLKALQLSSDTLTDQDLKQIAKVKSLEAIVLTQGAITDEGIQILSQLPKLKAVGLSYTKVTKEGAQDLKKKMPNLLIEVHPQQRGQIFDGAGCRLTSFSTTYFVADSKP
jgi:hypothetical protein